MVRKGSKDASKGNAGGAAKVGRSDSEILQERQKASVFTDADNYLHMMSWGLWALAALWFFGWAAASRTAWVGTVFGLVGCGVFCGSLSSAAPGGTWSFWRIWWHRLWGVAWGTLALDFGRVRIMTSAPAGSPAAVYAMWLVVGCSVAGCGALVTWPGSRTPVGVGKRGAVDFAEVCTVLDVFLTMIMGVGQIWDWEAWSDPLAIMVVPYVMWGIGTYCVWTDAEYIVAIFSSFLLHAAALVRIFMQVSRGSRIPVSLWQLAAVGVVLTIICHLLLFQAEPEKNPESNPFYVWRRRSQKALYALLADPVSGFGDD